MGIESGRWKRERLRPSFVGFTDEDADVALAVKKEADRS
jgi:hypothetical protein